MTEDFRARVDRELASIRPPTAFTAGELADKGRKRMWARRSGGAGAGAAAVVAVVLVFGTGGGPGAVQPAASASPSTSPSASAIEEQPVTQPEFPLPEHDPGWDYRWAPTGEETTPQTERLTGIWWAALGEIGARPVHIESGGAFSRETFSGLHRSVEKLWRLDENGDDPAAPEATRPVYEGLIGVDLDGTERPDGLTAAFYPKGSFLPGAHIAEPGSPFAGGDYRYLANGCEEYTFHAQGRAGWRAEFDCDDTGTGPSGQPVLKITERHIALDGESYEFRVLVVYQHNGNALKITDAVAWRDTTPISPDPKAGLPWDTLMALAFAFPETTVVV